MSNGPTLKRLPSGTTLTSISGAPGSLCALGLDQCRGERRGIDRHASAAATDRTARRNDPRAHASARCRSMIACAPRPDSGCPGTSGRCRADAPRTRTTRRHRRSAIAAGARRRARRSTGSCRSRRRRRAAQIQVSCWTAITTKLRHGPRSIAEIYIARSNQPRSRRRSRRSISRPCSSRVSKIPLSTRSPMRTEIACPSPLRLCEPERSGCRQIPGPRCQSADIVQPGVRQCGKDRFGASRLVRAPRSDAAGNGMPSGASARLTPNPITIAKAPPCVSDSRSIPATLPLPIRQHVIRPFERECDLRGKRPAAPDNREARDKAERRGDCGRHRGREQQAGGEIARRRNPFAAAPAAAGRLLAASTIQSGPRSPARASRSASLLVESSLS